MSLPHRYLITGPESTGKSTISKALAAHFDTTVVPEYAREYLAQNGPNYDEEDLLNIARGQLDLEDRLAQITSRLLIVDTGPLVLQIWSDVIFGQVHPWIAEQWQHRPYQHIFLCAIDWPWSYDPLREHPHRRKELMIRYQSLLQQSGRDFTLLRGTLEERLTIAIKKITDLEKSYAHSG